MPQAELPDGSFIRTGDRHPYKFWQRDDGAAIESGYGSEHRWFDCTYDDGGPDGPLTLGRGSDPAGTHARFIHTTGRLVADELTEGPFMTTRKYRLRGNPQVLFEGTPSAEPGIILVNIDGLAVAMPAEVLEPLEYEQPVAGFVYIKTGIFPRMFWRDPSWPENEWWDFPSDQTILWIDLCSLGEPIRLYEANPTTGICSGCGRMQRIRVDGRIKEHGPRPGCRGSGQLPAKPGTEPT